jgi:hypothetical protein
VPFGGRRDLQRKFKGHICPQKSKKIFTIVQT